MNLKLTCPVCDRPQIEGNICPNCETDLSLVRMLIELPNANVSRKIPIGWLILMASVSFGVGISVITMKFLFSG